MRLQSAGSEASSSGSDAEEAEGASPAKNGKKSEEGKDKAGNKVCGRRKCCLDTSAPPQECWPHETSDIFIEHNYFMRS